MESTVFIWREAWRDQEGRGKVSQRMANKGCVCQARNHWGPWHLIPQGTVGAGTEHRVQHWLVQGTRELGEIIHQTTWSRPQGCSWWRGVNSLARAATPRAGSQRKGDRDRGGPLWKENVWGEGAPRDSNNKPPNRMILLGEPGEGNGTPLQYSCLENPMDGGAC